MPLYKPLLSLKITIPFRDDKINISYYGLKIDNFVQKILMK
jgi:hypothetical protein